MTRKRKTFLWILAVVILAAAAVTLQVVRTRVRRFDIAQVALTGAVLRRDSDAQKQSPIANARIAATGGLSSANGHSDASGLFNLTLSPGILPGQPVTLKFEHPGYEPLEMTATPHGQLYIVRMKPVAEKPIAKPDHVVGPVKAPEIKVTEIKSIRVRYTSKNQTTITVGSVAKQFAVFNTGNILCDGRRPCSPDGKWKATIGGLSIDAQEGNELRNVRVSCVAGPCPFTKIEPEDLSNPGQKLKISALDWSDTATFLVEYEVARTMVTNQVRRSYPFTLGQTMTFALPMDAGETSIEADLNGEEIIFPLGPKLSLSWATCSVEVAPAGSKIYRCEVKPGYQIQQPQP
ncbi:MAG TPA: carboxypeptidase regulatory-like domain-containing protein [Bryobacteraceae bacterium]|jgi:hypothetical protein